VVPDLPAEALGELGADDDALTSGYIPRHASGSTTNWEKKFLGSW
jgi:hypothetical protein